MQLSLEAGNQINILFSSNISDSFSFLSQVNPIQMDSKEVAYQATSSKDVAHLFADSGSNSFSILAVEMVCLVVLLSFATPEVKSQSD